MAQEPSGAGHPARRDGGPGGREGRLIGAMVFQFFVALYGGFFGAGIGILMLAALGLLGQSNIHRMNGLKNFAAVCINGVAAADVYRLPAVHWPLALLMMVAAILGGYAGRAWHGDSARRTSAAWCPPSG